VHQIRRSALSSLLAIGAVLGLVTLSTLPASAQVSQATHLTISPRGGRPHCSGDVCARWLSKTKTTVKIEVWANNMDFYGHFELIPPTGVAHNSRDKVWDAGGAGQNFTVGLYPDKYTAIAWQRVSAGNYRNIGQVSFNV
jgi:hypothetical protein